MDYQPEDGFAVPPLVREELIRPEFGGADEERGRDIEMAMPPAEGEVEAAAAAEGEGEEEAGVPKPKPILKRAGEKRKRKKVVRMAVRDEALTYADEGTPSPSCLPRLFQGAVADMLCPHRNSRLESNVC